MLKNEMTNEKILDLIYCHIENEKLINDKDFFYAVAGEVDITSTDEDVEKIIRKLENSVNQVNKVTDHLKMNGIKYESIVNMLWISTATKPIQWIYDLLKNFKYKYKSFNTQGQLVIKF